MMFSFSACHEDFLTEQPYDFIGPDNFYNNADELEDLVSGVPRIFRETGSGMMGRNWYLLVETPAPAVTNRYNLTHLRTQMDSWTYNSGHSYINSVWLALYRGVNRANAVIDNGPNIEDDKEEPVGYNKRDRVVAEAKFYRALIYFFLTELWGEVPLRTEETVSLDGLELEKSPRSEIYNVIIQDLKDAEGKLPYADEYSGSTNDIGRPNKGAAQALLAKVLLTRAQRPEAQGSDLNDANAKLDEIISSGRHGLAANYADLIYFHNPGGSEDYAAHNYEVMFDLQFTSAGFGATGNNFMSPRNSDIGKNKWTTFAAEFEYVRSFEESDTRGDANFVLEYNNQNGGDLVVYNLDSVIWDGYRDEAMSFTKRLDPDPAVEGREEPNMKFLRYADVLLMKAEALDLLGQTNNAYEYVNMVRRRAFGKDPNSPDVDVDWVPGSLANFRLELYKERLKELVLENWGTIDMRRMWDVATPIVEAHSKHVEMQPDEDGTMVEILNDGPKWEVTDFSDKFKVFPIPAQAMDRNPSLIQTPGWD